MKKNQVSIIEQKELELSMLQQQSASALDIVTNTITDLEMVNNEIIEKINEITNYKTQLQNTEDKLSQTQIHNAKIIEKFKALIA